MQQIPVSTDAFATFKVLLDNQLVNIDLMWQDVSQSWFISVYSSDKVFIDNKRLVENELILAKFRLRGFKGGLVASSFTNEKLDRDSFSKDFSLYYLTEAEINGLQSI
jgi:hypothetical protein